MAPVSTTANTSCYCVCRREAELEERQLERDWYDNEEFGGAHNVANAFGGDEDSQFEKRTGEMQQRMKRRDGSVMTLAQSKRASELEKSLNAWEENRLLTSGVVARRQVRGRGRVGGGVKGGAPMEWWPGGR